MEKSSELQNFCNSLDICVHGWYPYIGNLAKETVMYARPFTAMVVENEVSVLERLHGMLEAKALETKEQFSDLMNAAFKRCRLEYTALADDLGYSHTAVYRWVQGESAPHKSLWPDITRWIMAAITERLDQLPQNEESADATYM